MSRDDDHVHRILSIRTMITCNEEMKGYAKCNNSRSEPPFGGLTGNAQSLSMVR